MSWLNLKQYEADLVEIRREIIELIDKAYFRQYTQRVPVRPYLPGRSGWLFESEEKRLDELMDAEWAMVGTPQDARKRNLQRIYELREQRGYFKVAPTLLFVYFGW